MKNGIQKGKRLDFLGTDGFLRSSLGGLYLEGFIHGGAHFRNFTVI